MLVAKPALGGQIEHLTSGHAANSSRARQFQNQVDPYARIGMNAVARHHVERQSEQRVAGQNRGRFAESLVHRRPSTAQFVVVHRRQIVMHQRIAVQAFECCARQQRALARRAEQRRCFYQQKRPQSFPAAEHGMAHGGQQPLWTYDFARTGHGAEQPLKQCFDIGGNRAKTICEVLRCDSNHDRPN